MGIWLGRRTEPRVDFREAVRVIWPGEVSGIVARAVNLSLAGILVDAPTPTPCRVGSDVLCDVSLPRGPRLLRGRVAHRRVLPSAKVGMGIEFVDLSPHEVADLRDVVEENDQKSQATPQRVRVHFAGTEQIVRARAYPREGGLRLVTSLPFLKVDTEVDLTLASDVEGGAKGWVSSVALERGSDGVARLLIDVRIDSFNSWFDPSTTLPRLVEPIIPPPVDTPSPLEAMLQHGWEAADHVVATALTAADFQQEAPFDLAEDLTTPTISSPTVPHVPHLEMSPVASLAPVIEPSHVASTVPFPVSSIIEGPGASPGFESADQTEIVSLERPTGRWRALVRGMLVGAVGLAALMGAVALIRNAAPPESAASLGPPVIVTQKAAVELPPVAPTPQPPAPPAAPTPVAAAAPGSAEAAVATRAPAIAPSSDFVVSLMGSIAGSRRYPLSNPDGVAFNLPHASAAMKVGTYRPDVPGLRSVWVRALPGGGVHLRFHYTNDRPAPRIELTRTGVRVIAP
jgi:hypothetical protein